MKSVRPAWRAWTGFMMLMSAAVLGFAQNRPQNPGQTRQENRGLGVRVATNKSDSTPTRSEVRPELVLQTGHTFRTVSSVSFSPDGRWLASAQGETIKLSEAATGREIRSFINSNSVNDLAFSVDGRLLASAGLDNTIRFWDVEGGKEVRTLRGHVSGVLQTAFSPDGRWLASCGVLDRAIRLWDVASGGEARTPCSHNDSVFGLDFSPDGRMLASRGLDNAVKIWEVGTWKLLRTLTADTGSLAFSPDSRWIALGSDAGVGIWETATAKLVRTLPGQKGVRAVAFSRDGQWLASVGVENFKQSTKLWDPKSGRLISTLPTGGPDLAFSPDGRLLAVAAGDAQVWDVASGSQVYALTPFSRTLESVAISADGRSLRTKSVQSLSSSGKPDNKENSVSIWETATGRMVQPQAAAQAQVLAISQDARWVALHIDNRTFAIQDLSTGKIMHSLVGSDTLIRPSPLRLPSGAVAVREGRIARIQKVLFSPDAALVAAASEDGTIKLWDVTTGREIRRLVGDELVFSPDGRWLASGGGNNPVKIWEITTGKETSTLSERSKKATPVTFSLDGRLLACSREGVIIIWDVSTRREVATLGGRSANEVALSPEGRWLAAFGNPGALWDLSTGLQIKTLVEGISGAFSPDGHMLAIGCRDTTIKLWRVGSWQSLGALVGHKDTVEDVAFSPDGRIIASTSGYSLTEPTFKLWDVESRRELRELSGVSGRTSALAFSRDGRWLAASSNYREVKIWDVRSGSQTHTFLGHNDNVTAVTFSSDGRYVASGSWDGAIKIWDLATSRELVTLGGHTRGVVALAFSSDMRRLVSGESGGGFKQWEVGIWRELRSQTGPDIAGSGFISGDARWLASVSDNIIRLWDLETGIQVRTLKGYGSEAMAFSPDGRRLASVGGLWDDRVRVWDVETASELRSMRGHGPEGISDVAYGPDGRWLVSAGRDGSARVWDAESGDELAALVSARETGEWLVVTPDGLFDGSPTAWNRIVWRFAGNDIFPVETFFNEFFHPGLLADILAGKRPRAARNILEVDRRQPAVTLALGEGQPSPGGTISSRNLTLKVEVAETQADPGHPSGSGARDVRLFRNGSLVKAWRGSVLEGKQGKIVLETTISVVAGENRLVAYAFNRDNIKSADATLVVTGAESLKRKGTAYIIAIGVNQYANSDYNLKYAVADAQAFAEEFQRQQTKLASYANIEVIPLIDREATKANILKALKRLAGDPDVASASNVPAVLQKLQYAQPEDAVIVYFAGHGTAQQSRFYLIPHDLGYSGSRSALTEAGLTTILSHSISDVDLERALEKVDAGQLLLVIDACNSGQALEAEEKRRGPMNSKGLAQLAYEKGMYILTAAQGYQAALEAAQLGHGYLTYALVEEGLKTAAADGQPKDGLVAAREWLDYATLRVPQMQMAKMQEARALKHAVAFVDGEEKLDDVAKRSLQRPRVFYRREPESQPMIVAKP